MNNCYVYLLEIYVPHYRWHIRRFQRTGRRKVRYIIDSSTLLYRLNIYWVFQCCYIYREVATIFFAFFAWTWHFDLFAIYFPIPISRASRGINSFAYFLVKTVPNWKLKRHLSFSEIETLAAVYQYPKNLVWTTFFWYVWRIHPLIIDNVSILYIFFLRSNSSTYSTHFKQFFVPYVFSSGVFHLFVKYLSGPNLHH